jgi:hypothetical protein
MRKASVIVCLPLLLVGACAGPLNTEPCVGPGMKSDSNARAFCPPTITESALREAGEDAAPTVIQRNAPVYYAAGVVSADDARPGNLSLDRSGWAPIDLVVPNDLAAHQPRYTTNLRLNDTSRRARGEYPTPASALDTGTSEGNDRQIHEALLAPFVAGADMVLFLPRAAVQARPYRPTRTGLEPYQRQPRVQTVVPPPLTTIEPEAAKAPIPSP